MSHNLFYHQDRPQGTNPPVRALIPTMSVLQPPSLSSVPAFRPLWALPSFQQAYSPLWPSELLAPWDLPPPPPRTPAGPARPNHCLRSAHPPPCVPEQAWSKPGPGGSRSQRAARTRVLTSCRVPHHGLGHRLSPGANTDPHRSCLPSSQEVRCGTFNKQTIPRFRSHKEKTVVPWEDLRKRPCLAGQELFLKERTLGLRCEGWTVAA